MTCCCGLCRRVIRRLSITAYGSDGARLRVTIDGWYQLLGNGRQGDLLFGNSFSTRGTWGFIPSVVLVDGRKLLGHMRDIDQESTREDS